MALQFRLMALSPAPAYGFSRIGGVSFGGVGTAALCSEFCCCHDEEIVVLRLEKREIDKTNIIPGPSVVSSCADLQEKDEQLAGHEKVTDVH